MSEQEAAVTASTARYIYSVARSSERLGLGEIGLLRSAVFTIPYKDISAVVHSCQPSPYESKDRSVAESWIIEHSFVIDQAMKRFGTVLPFSFDVILKGDDSAVSGWLEKNYYRLHEELERVKGRAEYGIQIYYNYDDLAERLIEEDSELSEMRSRIDSESKGRAYLLKKRFNQLQKSRTAQRASDILDRSLSGIRTLASEIMADEKKRIPQDYQSLSLLASYACLVEDEKVEQLGKVLDEINEMKGFRVRFTGPWAPYSFVKCRDLS